VVSPLGQSFGSESQKACGEDRLLRSCVCRLICFNLGYFPGSDVQLTTTPETTLAALNAAVEVLAVGGHISILAYVGHAGGM
jgi:hypothetical protein